MTEAGQLPEIDQSFWKISIGNVLYASGNKPRLYPKGWRGQLVRVLPSKTGGGTYSVQDIIFMKRMEDKLTPIKIKTWASRKVSGCLETRVG